MKLYRVFYVFLFVSCTALADTNREINYLLNFVASTDCKYERNGDMHSGKEAVKHIKKKYNYYEDDIETTEDFIKFSATKSTISGDRYKIHCANQPPVQSSVWLLSELSLYRTQTAKDAEM